MPEGRQGFDPTELERLERLLRGGGTPEEQAAAMEPLRSQQAGALLPALNSLDGTTGELLRRWDAPTALARFHRRHGLRATRRLPRLVFASGDSGKPLGWLVAAAAVVATAVAASVSRGDRAVASHVGVATQPARDIVTASGQRAIVDLVDGTHVTLSAESHLRIAAGFGTRNAGREVSLEGEALFVVRHDSAHPFVIHTANGSVEDLGTEFIVSTYPEVSGTRLAVREGKVVIRPRSPASPLLASGGVAVLSPGDVGIMRDNGSVQVAHRQDLTDLFAASRGSLVIRAQAFEDAIPRLERWFGVRVRVANRALLSRSISVELRDGAATDAFGIIALALKARASWHQNQVTIESDDLR